MGICEDFCSYIECSGINLNRPISEQNRRVLLKHYSWFEGSAIDCIFSRFDGFKSDLDISNSMSILASDSIITEHRKFSDPPGSMPIFEFCNFTDTFYYDGSTLWSELNRKYLALGIGDFLRKWIDGKVEDDIIFA